MTRSSRCTLRVTRCQTRAWRWCVTTVWSRRRTRPSGRTSSSRPISSTYRTSSTRCVDAARLSYLQMFWHILGRMRVHVVSALNGNILHTHAKLNTVFCWTRFSCDTTRLHIAIRRMRLQIQPMFCSLFVMVPTRVVVCCADRVLPPGGCRWRTSTVTRWRSWRGRCRSSTSCSTCRSASRNSHSSRSSATRPSRRSRPRTARRSERYRWEVTHRSERYRWEPGYRFLAISNYYFI